MRAEEILHGHPHQFPQRDSSNNNDIIMVTYGPKQPYIFPLPRSGGSVSKAFHGMLKIVIQIGELAHNELWVRLADSMFFANASDICQAKESSKMVTSFQ